MQQPPYNDPNQNPEYRGGYNPQPGGPGPGQQYNPQFNPMQMNAGASLGKDWTTALLLCIFFGYLGVHRFYVGKSGSGIAMLFTFGGCGIWSLVDLITIITGSFTDANGQPLVRK